MTRTIGIDLGTSGIKAVLMDDGARVLGTSAQPIAVSIPQVGWSEQDPDAWVATVFACLDDLAARHPEAMASVQGIGLSGQMLACLILDHAHRPLRPAMLWNDQRAVAECADLLERVPDIGRRSNGTPDPGITAPKLLWLRRHEPQVLERAAMLMLTKDYVRLALTGEVASDPTDAGGTQLFDVAAGAWAADFCAAAGWDLAHLPPVLPSWSAAGGLRPGLARRFGLKAGLPVAAGAGDNMGSTLGAGAARPGDAVLTIGTSAVSCIVDAAFHPGPEQAILTSAHAAPDTFLSMGVVMSATASLDWAGRLTGRSAADLARAAEALDPAAQASAPVVLPCLNGLRTPVNRPAAQARVDGLHPAAGAAELAFGVLEGVAFQIADCVAAQARVGARAGRFLAVGGGTRSDLWLRLIATALDAELELPEGADVAGPAGAARLALVAAGAGAETLATPRPTLRRIAPDPRLAARMAERKARFDRLLAEA